MYSDRQSNGFMQIFGDPLNLYTRSQMYAMTGKPHSSHRAHLDSSHAFHKSNIAPPLVSLSFHTKTRLRCSLDSPLQYLAIRV